jgi:endonuclease YncB( thermonuclease family)
VSKHWNPPRQTTKLRPSRIRRDPLLVPPALTDKKSEWRSADWDRRFAIAGIIAFAFAIAVVTLGFSAITAHIGGGAPVDVQRFGSCRNEGGPNCVLDGDTIRIDGEQVVIAGMVAPKVEAAHCGAEEQRGAKAVEQLLRLLNSGKVTSGGAIRGAYGVSRRNVEVDGRDVAAAMIAAGVAREDDSEMKNWCS